MKRRGFIKSVLGGIAGLVGGKIAIGDEKAKEYLKALPNDDGWVILDWLLDGSRFTMRFKAVGDWDKSNNENAYIDIDYARLVRSESPIDAVILAKKVGGDPEIELDFLQFEVKK